ncbi:M1 family metallopeptidase [Actinomadura syzygii]|uniref:Aminopeptidase N n=1 Tax=Actinomadura syzygii TaxID=1427538 RepID=A0A5D0UE39_9ACTN|nr:M1 family metallopeptidase [Actinomadura syzygii]TYC16070.1 M1 family metallopeptidase [Actinomadura syzygii]
MRRTPLLAVTAAATGVVLCATSALAAPGPGAPGIGDPYYPDYGNGGYDVGHYDLDLKYQPATDTLQGTAKITARATQDLSRFNLDFLLDTQKVTVNGRKAVFAKSGAHELVITPARALRKGSRIEIAVSYSDVPSTKKYNDYVGWARTPDGAVAAQEPESAWWWFPSNDHPLDKASYDIRITVPEGLQTISNGEPRRSRTSHGWTTTAWHEAKPQATYLATLAVGKFEVHQGRTESGLPVITAYSPDVAPALLKAAKASIELTPEIVDWASTVFGPYPFTSIGGYVPNVKSRFSLEEQTRVFYSPAAFASGVRPYLIVHENAHQWFGDSVSLTTWRDIWLNEGFASYAEWLWSEKTGQGTAAEVAKKTYDSYPADDPFWKVKVADPGPGENQFHDAVYDRGALTLQALRAAVGDAKFFAILRTWVKRHRYGNATTAQFEALSEKISGKDLHGLFQTWLYTPGRPASPPQRVAVASSPRSWKEIRQTRTLEGR